MPISRDEFQALADTRYDEEAYDTPDQRAFSMLVDLCSHVYQLYLEADVPNTDDPKSFTPDTLGGVPYGWGLLEGLRENMEINHPDGEFREMLPGRRMYALSDCINWSTNQQGDCGGRVENVGGVIICENCRNKSGH